MELIRSMAWLVLVWLGCGLLAGIFLALYFTWRRREFPKGEVLREVFGPWLFRGPFYLITTVYVLGRYWGED